MDDDGDRGDRTYGVIIACDNPQIDGEFADSLDVWDEGGKFETYLRQPANIGCEIGDLCDGPGSQ